jgi:hypothetical protein
MDKFGHGVVEIVKDSNTVEIEKLDPNKVCYACLTRQSSSYQTQLQLIKLLSKCAFEQKKMCVIHSLPRHVHDCH